MKNITIGAGDFKAHCLRLLDEVNEKHTTLIITKRGKVVAKLVPPDDEPPKSLYGCLKGLLTIKGDIIAPTDENWDADNHD